MHYSTATRRALNTLQHLEIGPTFWDKIRLYLIVSEVAFHMARAVMPGGDMYLTAMTREEARLHDSFVDLLIALDNNPDIDWTFTTRTIPWGRRRKT